MPPRRVVLHVGTPKTGTTHLQHVLWQHRQELARHGVHYPGDTEEAQFHATVDLLGGEFNRARHTQAQGAWSGLVERVRGLAGTVVVSHELLGDAPEEVAARAVADLLPAQVHVVLTARDLARQLPSVWQEDLKNRGTQTWPDFLAGVRQDPPPPGPAEDFWHRQDLPRVLRRWTAGLPREQMHVVTVPPPGSPPGLLWQRFAQVLGVPPGVVDPTAELRANRSLSPVEAELLRRLNDRLPDDVDPVRYVQVVGHLVEEVLPGDGPRLRLPADAAAWATERGRALAGQVAATGCEVVGDLDDLLPRPAPEEGAVAPAADDELLGAALRLLTGALFTAPVPPPPPPPGPLLLELGRRLARTRLVSGRAAR